jgi:hypothetical protein
VVKHGLQQEDTQVLVLKPGLLGGEEEREFIKGEMDIHSDSSFAQMGLWGCSPPREVLLTLPEASHSYFRSCSHSLLF